MWEVLRKLIHLAGLLTVLAYTLLSHYFSERIAILVLTGFLLILLELEYLRVERKSRIMSAFGGMFRQHEENQIAGSVFYIISCIICFAAFDYWVAVLAMFMTAFGDILAALVGKKWGETKLYKNKSVVGTFAGFTANIVVGMIILIEFPLLVFAMAFIATFVEFITDKLDDNLTVPLFTGFLGQMLVYLLGINLPMIDLSFLHF